jgi:hypothetical protein
MKFIFCIGSYFVPKYVDDWNKKYDSAIVIEDQNQEIRVCLGLDRDDKLSKPYMPYYARVLSKEKMIWLRDQLTKLIEET